MKKNRIACMALAAAMTLSLAACGGEPTMEDPEPGSPLSGGAAIEAVTKQPDRSDPIGKTKPGRLDPAPIPDLHTAVSPTWFEDSFQAYLDDAGMSGQSYMASPASFRAALCLAIEGARGDTQEGLLQAARFGSVEDMRAWYDSLLSAQAEFRAYAADLAADSVEYGDGTDPGMAFDIANAVWDNTDFPGGFLDAYEMFIAERYGAKAGSSDKEHITGDVNAWCDEQTQGMVKEISPDLSDASAVLANALYVKSAWLDKFSDGMTENGDFMLADGSVVEKDFMRSVRRVRYHEDQSGRRYAMFGLEGNLWLTVCLDPDVRVQDMYTAAYDAASARLDVSMPKLDLETELGAEAMCGYLLENGAGEALGNDADFTGMTDSPNGWHIDAAVQKTRLKTDEEGMEAAAVTILVMKDNMAAREEDEPIEFHMDRPFSFMITSGLNTQESGATVLFFGRYAG